MRFRRFLATVLLFLSTPTTALAAAPSTGDQHSTASVPKSFTISGIDLHDAQIVKFGRRYFMYGSMYGCGFQWLVRGTKWCGFGVSTARKPQGPWSEPRLLFSTTSLDPSTLQSWQETCGRTGQGCFNPRMIRRKGWGKDDGAYILWFNAPRQYSMGAENAYNVMGCNGPVGPCGPEAGSPFGSYKKPDLDICRGNGDFGLIDSGTPGARPALVCTRPGTAALSIQELNRWGSGGTPGRGVERVAGISKAEGPGGYWDRVHRRYVLTYSDHGCGYCAGTPIGYATAPSLYDGWSAPGNVGWGAPLFGRRAFHANSCGGQPRTVTVLDGRPWQIIDLWLGTRNEAGAATHLVPLRYAPTPGVPGDGQIWRPPLTLNC